MKRKESRALLREVTTTPSRFFRHCGGYLSTILKEVEDMTDPRDTSYIQYNQQTMILMGTLKNVTGTDSMRSMTERFNTEEFIENLGRIVGVQLKEVPHFVTLNNYLSRLEPAQLEKVQQAVVRRMIEGRAFEQARFRKSWLIIIDGVDYCSFKTHNDEFCLTTVHNRNTENEWTHYYHKALEAKLYLGNDMVVSIATEFIENNGEDAEKQRREGSEKYKQDCEMKAFCRLAEKLKKAFPKLPVTILGDSLYATETLFRICEENGWPWIIRFKDGSMPAVAAEFQSLKDRDPRNSKEFKNGETRGQLKWVNDIVTDYDRAVHVLELEETKRGETKHFQWITNIEINENNAKSISKTGRLRWKIENEGFNNQKNHRYNLEHVCCHDYRAIRNHYLLIQLADVLRQLYEQREYRNKGLDVTIKNISSNLLQMFTRLKIAGEDIFINSYMTPITS